MQNVPLSRQALTAEGDLNGPAARLLELVIASRLDLADEGGWEALADQCEEAGEPDDVTHLALATAWRVALARLHGLVEWEREVMKSVARLKQSPSSQGVLRCLEELRKDIEAARDSASRRDVLSPAMLRAALVALDRVRALHDRLKARGLLRES